MITVANNFKLAAILNADVNPASVAGCRGSYSLHEHTYVKCP
jgi:hypothetical protein